LLEPRCSSGNVAIVRVCHVARSNLESACTYGICRTTENLYGTIPSLDLCTIEWVTKRNNTLSMLATAMESCKTDTHRYMLFRFIRRIRYGNSGDHGTYTTSD
jgi:hypothetical protein